MKRKTRTYGVLLSCITVASLVLASHSTHMDARAATTIQQENTAEKPPKPLSLMMCPDSQSARQSLHDKFMLEVKNGDHKTSDLTQVCKAVSVMSDDYVFTPHFNGLGDEEHKRKYPIAFEVFVVDADCERHCPNKAEGWVSSYELPLDFWPAEDEWVEARANRLIMEGHITGMSAANRMLKRIKEYPKEGQAEMYKRGRDIHLKGFQFMRNYGLQ